MYCARTLAKTALVVLITIAAATRSPAAEIVVGWTAPGGDGNSGRAAAYDLRCSRELITPDGFARATAVTSVPAPGVAGADETCTVSGLEAGVTYYFAIKAVDASGNWSEMSNVIFGRIPETSEQVATLTLSFSAPRPNPARELTSFRLALPAAAPVQVDIFDVAGRRVRQLAQSEFSTGLVDLPFDLRDDEGARLARGVYLVRARLGGVVFTRRLVVAR